MVVALGSPSIQSAPTGIGSLADNGCTCHGGYSNTTQPTILGLPEEFESNFTYNLTLSVEAYSGQHSESAQGGFRLLISNGSVEIQNQSRVQFLDGGWTHTESGNQYRSWNLSWTAPSDNTTTVDFVLHGNAVNGNGNSEGDMWNSFGTVVPGVQHEGPVEQLNLTSELDDTQYGILYAGLIALLLFLYFAIK
jgi:hypothetical protein